MYRRTLLKSLPLGLVSPCLAPLVARAEAEAQGHKPMRFVFVVEGNGLWPDHVMPAGFKRQNMPNPRNGGQDIGGSWGFINGADELIDLSLRGPNLPLHEALSPLQKHIQRVTLLTGLSGRVAGGGHTSYFGVLGAYLGAHNAARDITIDAALAKTSPAIRPLVSLGFMKNEPHDSRSFFTGYSAYGPNQPVSAIQDPVLAHKVLFGKLVGGDVKSEVGSQAHLLELLAEQISELRPHLPGAEGQKLERTADAFSSIGRRQHRLGEIDPTKIRPVRPDFHGSPSETTRTEAHFELAETALLTGLTNTVTLLIAPQSDLDVSWRGLGITTQHSHDIGHAGRKPEAAAARVTIRKFVTGQVAKLVDTLESVPEGKGTMMDNTLIVLLNAAAEDHHATAMEWPMVLVGNLGGRLKAGGRFINVPKYGAKGHATVAQFYTSLLHAAGAPVDHFGMKDRSLIEAGLLQKEPWGNLLARS